MKKEMEVFKERRKEIRIKEDNRITFQVISDTEIKPDDDYTFSLSKNISVGGINLLSNKSLSQDTKLKIDLLLSKTQELITVFGNIKWINDPKTDEPDAPYEMGLEFVDSNQRTY